MLKKDYQPEMGNLYSTIEAGVYSEQINRGWGLPLCRACIWQEPRDNPAHRSKLDTHPTVVKNDHAELLWDTDGQTGQTNQT